jgi:hypothetical protein
VELSSVKTVLRYNKEKGVEDLGIEPKLHCNHFLEVWHLFCWICGLMMFA